MISRYFIGKERFLPSFPRDSSSFWIWFSKKIIAMAKANRARSWNFGGIFNLKSPIKKSSTERTCRDRELYDTQFMDAKSSAAIPWFPQSNINTHSKLHCSGHLLPQQKQFRVKCCMFVEYEQLRLCFPWVAAVVYVQLLINPGKYRHVVSVRMRIRRFWRQLSLYDWIISLDSGKYDSCPLSRQQHLTFTVNCSCIHTDIFCN